MSEYEDFRKRVDRTKAEVDAEIAADRERRFTALGFDRSPKRAVRRFLIDTLGELWFWAVFALFVIGAVAYGLFIL